MADNGSVPTGPSEQYLRLLKGEITPEQYAKSVRKRVDAQRRSERSSSTSRSREGVPEGSEDAGLSASGGEPF